MESAMPPESITLSADEAAAVLGTLDDARAELDATDKLGLLLAIEDAAAILIDKLFPDEGLQS